MPLGAVQPNTSLALVLLLLDPSTIVPIADTLPAAANKITFSVLAYLAFYAL